MILAIDFSWFNEWVAGGVAVIIAGVIALVFRKKGVNLKRILAAGRSFFKELGEAFLASSDVLDKADGAINEKGKIVKKNVKDVVEAGKDAKKEWMDVFWIFRKKKS